MKITICFQDASALDFEMVWIQNFSESLVSTGIPGLSVLSYFNFEIEPDLKTSLAPTFR